MSRRLHSLRGPGALGGGALCPTRRWSGPSIGEGLSVPARRRPAFLGSIGAPPVHRVFWASFLCCVLPQLLQYGV